MNLPQVDWKGVADHGNVTQAFINRLVQENGYTQLVDNTDRRKFIAGHLPYSTRRCIYNLQCCTRDQRPLRNFVTVGRDRKWRRAATETVSTAKQML